MKPTKYPHKVKQKMSVYNIIMGKFSDFLDETRFRALS